MAQANFPGGNDGDITKVEGRRKTEVSRQEDAEKSEEQPSLEVLTVRRCLAKHSFSELENYLKELGGQAATISSDTRSRAEKEVGRMGKVSKMWDMEAFQQNLEQKVDDQNYLDALRLVKQNEQLMLESWVQSLLEQKLYHQARSLLSDYAKKTEAEGKPQKRMSRSEIELEASIDWEILSGIQHQLEDKSQIETARLDYRYERIWSMVHGGFYSQAAEMCDQLNKAAYGERKSVRAETPEQIRKRHEAELMEAMPASLEEMKKVFPDLQELMSHFHHLAGLNEGNEAMTRILKARFELLVERLFDEQKIVVSGNGLVRVEEELLGIIDDLGYIGMKLYINTGSRNDRQLHLLYEDEAETDPAYKSYKPVDLRNLSADDLVIDNVNFKKEPVQTPEVSDEEKTAVGSEAKCVWISKSVTITPKKAQELRDAA